MIGVGASDNDKDFSLHTTRCWNYPGVLNGDCRVLLLKTPALRLLAATLALAEL